MSTERRRGRPRDPAVDEAVLRETLAQLDAHGYERLRVADVGRNAGVGLGSLYRRWPTKYALVVEALRAAAPAQALQPTDDPAADLLATLLALAEELRHHGPLLAVLLADPTSEVAAAVREAKLQPLHEATRARLRRITGPAPDLDARAASGPALIFHHHLLHGVPPTEDRIRAEIIPLMTR
ncbi:helix-turn-helix domain-containing protein [Spirillospora sp. NPDC047279]|uniref:TetR/AcrR family transcriptional regulator n=1 Tax=Spirillospora sp. NPDC047279 TaxID=3155478 RepID=UPI0033C0611C